MKTKHSRNRRKEIKKLEKIVAGLRMYGNVSLADQ
jgi:hypothetical protein